jgi:DNA-binding MarR family transcriptional regulator
MTAEPRETSRRALAFAMLTQLPRFGIWAESVREFDTPFGTIGYRQASILWVLRFELLPRELMTPTGFATFHRIQPSVVTRALAKLEQHGFIQRAIDPVDTRVSHISITEAGIAISQYIEQLYIDDLLAALAIVPDAELCELERSVAVLSRIVDDLDERRLRRTRRAPHPRAANSGSNSD